MKLRKIPRGTFWIGGLASLALAIPLLAVALHALTHRLGWGRHDPPLDHTFWISLIFAGIPALVAGGGVARLIAHRMAERPHLTIGGALLHGGVTMAVAGLGLGLLASLPLGVLPEDPRSWLPIGIIGLLVGGITGLAVTVLAGLRQRRFVAARRRAAAT